MGPGDLKNRSTSHAMLGARGHGSDAELHHVPSKVPNRCSNVLREVLETTCSARSKPTNTEKALFIFLLGLAGATCHIRAGAARREISKQ